VAVIGNAIKWQLLNIGVTVFYYFCCSSASPSHCYHATSMSEKHERVEEEENVAVELEAEEVEKDEVERRVMRCIVKYLATGKWLPELSGHAER